MIDDYKNIVEELKKEIQKYSRLSNLNKRKRKYALYSQFIYRALRTFLSAFIPYTTLIILFKNVILLPIVNFIIPICITTISIYLGTLIVDILDYKSRIKSNKKRQNLSDKIQEEIYYSIKLEETKNRTKIFQITLGILGSPRLKPDSLADIQTINNCNIKHLESNIKKSAEKLTLTLKEKYKRIKILSYQKILQKRFWKVRSKRIRITKSILTGLLGGLLITTLCSIPYVTILNIQASSIANGFISAFLSTFCFISGYMIKRNKDYISAINNLNKKLNVLLFSENLEEAEMQNCFATEKLITEISEIQVILLNLESVLKNIDDNDDREKHIENTKTYNTTPLEKSQLPEKGKSFTLKKKTSWIQ